MRPLFSASRLKQHRLRPLCFQWTGLGGGPRTCVSNKFSRGAGPWTPAFRPTALVSTRASGFEWLPAETLLRP